MNKPIKELYKIDFDINSLAEKDRCSLNLWYSQLINKNFSELTLLDVSRMLRQNTFVDFAIQKSIEFLTSDCFIGELWDGQLLTLLSKCKSEELLKYKRELLDILSKVSSDIDAFEWSTEIDKQEFKIYCEILESKIVGDE